MSVHIRFGGKGAVYCTHPLGGQPKIGHPSTDPRIRVSIRHVLADEIDRLLNLIDALDDDPDLEPSGDDEPSLGWTHTMAHGTTDDAEQSEVSP